MTEATDNDEKDKRVVIRIDPDLWQLLDDKRHAQKTTFQAVGLVLFQRWLSQAAAEERSSSGEKVDIIVNKSGLSKSRDKLHTSGQISVSEENFPWVKLIVDILEGRNEVAVRALKSNALAFSDYVRAVPEVSDGFADIVADLRRITSIQQRLVDAGKAPDVGVAPDPKAARGKHAKKAV